VSSSKTSDESKHINDVRAPKIIIAGSGMINGGRIQHHVLRYVSDPKSMVLIVSYQAEGTIGRRLLQGAREVKIYGQTVPVHAEVRAIGAYSAHGDQNKLVRWVADAKRPPKKIFLVHGEPASRDSMEEKLKEALPGVEVYKPMVGESAEV
ncbi:MAG: RNA-metabolising metallo-beta-lactamase, partial [Candidatus Magasanikbacteria bacterium GW2011_GWC2_45_8]